MKPTRHDPVRRRTLERLLASATAALTAPAALSLDLPADTGDPAEVLELWPDGPPGGDVVTVKPEIVERENPWKLRDRVIRFVRSPSLIVFRAVGRPKGAFLLLPGGGYKHVVIDKEGFETARWFASEGFTTFVLFYRLPGDGWSAGPDAPLQDAQRALSLIRSRASEWHLEPGRLGVAGFSAGGHLAARTATRHALRSYEPVDQTDQISARPDVAAMLYPVITLEGTAAHAGSRDCLLGLSPSPARVREYPAQIGVGTDTPPSFLLHAADDTAVPLENSLLMHGALRDAGVPTDLHVFTEGGHGFGLRGVADRPVAAWPALLRDWALRNFERGSAR
jgi:acetyl esterase/lipase